MKPREDGQTVFCTKCKYSKGIRLLFNDIDESCEHPENVYIEKSYDRPYKRHRSDPDEINKYNSCKWYKRRWSLFASIVKLFGK